MTLAAVTRRNCGGQDLLYECAVTDKSEELSAEKFAAFFRDNVGADRSATSTTSLFVPTIESTTGLL